LSVVFFGYFADTQTHARTNMTKYNTLLCRLAGAQGDKRQYYHRFTGFHLRIDNSLWWANRNWITCVDFICQ